MSGPNEHEMHPRKIFIRQCEKLVKFLESWIFRALQKKADILHNLWKDKVLIRTVWQVSECHAWVFAMGGPSQNLCVL